MASPLPHGDGGGEGGRRRRRKRQGKTRAGHQIRSGAEDGSTNPAHLARRRAEPISHGDRARQAVSSMSGSGSLSRSSQARTSIARCGTRRIPPQPPPPPGIKLAARARVGRVRSIVREDVGWWTGRGGVVVVVDLYLSLRCASSLCLCLSSSECALNFYFYSSSSNESLLLL